ncbi:MAG: MATE family efflux transporter [Deltaproteobacteria bacterium]
MVAELGWMGMGLVDTAMVGRVSAVAMGAVAVGANVFFLFMAGGLGLLFGLDTVVAQAVGAREPELAHRALVQGLFLALGSSLLLMGGMVAAGNLLGWIGVTSDVLPTARTYLAITALSMPPIALFMALRRYLQAMNLVGAFMVIVLFANVLNALVNWLLVFGNLGFTALGAAGSAWATVASRCFMMVALAAYTLWHARRNATGLLQTPFVIEMPLLRRIVRIGLPAAGQILLESGFFNVAALLAARFGSVPLAAHQIAISAASFSFMAPLGISSAAAVRVGQAVGRRDGPGARLAGWTAIVCGGIMMFVFAAAFLFFGREIAAVFTDETAVITIAASILTVAAAFQLVDGTQVVAVGALRGLGETRLPMRIALLSYWMVGMSLAVALAFWMGLGVIGLWYGFVVGLALACVLLVGVWFRHARDPLHHSE